MGQSRYERLPKTQNWQNVVALLATPHASVSEIASETAKACRGALKRHSDDPVLVASVFLLARLPLAARKGEAGRFLQECGLDAKSLSSLLSLLDESARYFRFLNLKNPDPSFVTEISELSFEETLSKLASESNLSLFADSAGQVELAFASFGTARGFARIARIYFTTFMSRVLTYFLSMETVNSIGAHERFESVDHLQQFAGQLRRYCWESSKIIDSFAEEWYSKYRWQERLDREHVATFVWAVLRKFSSEIGRENIGQ
jgi:hypothetical protein